jgi:hypothetical protein
VVDAKVRVDHCPRQLWRSDTAVSLFSDGRVSQASIGAIATWRIACNARTRSPRTDVEGLDAEPIAAP